MNITVTTNQMRHELVKNITQMRELRKSVIREKKVLVENTLSYKRIAIVGAAYADAIENPKIVKPFLDDLEKTPQDQIILGYDSSQNDWWIEEIKSGRKFLNDIRMLSIHSLHSGLKDSQDVFHMFQIMKLRFEQDPNKRQNEWFVQPAYGGLFIPHEYLGPLLVNLTKNKYLMPIKSQNRLTLELDWWPDSNENSIKQVKKVLQTAQKLGYNAISFLLPEENQYPQLDEQTEWKMNTVSKQSIESNKIKNNWQATISIERKETITDPVVQMLNIAEFGEKPLSQLLSDMHDPRSISFEIGENTIAVIAIQDLQFSDALYVGVQNNEQYASAGFYLSSAPDKSTSIMHEIICNKIGTNVGNENAWSEAITEVTNAMHVNYAYVTIQPNTSAEINIEGAENSIKWKDM